MKINKMSTAAALIFSAAATVFASCSGENKNEKNIPLDAAPALEEAMTVKEVEEDSAFSSRSYHWEKTDKPTQYGATSSVDADYPFSGPSKALYASRKWIADQLDLKEARDLSNGEMVVAEAGEMQLDRMVDELKSIGDEWMPGMGLEYAAKIKREYQNDYVVSFSSSIYTYEGGAHGGTSLYCATFFLSSGKRFGYDMFTDRDALSDIVVECLKLEYDPEIFFTPDELGLPVSEPYIDAQCVKFYYQQYEIAPYSEGIIICTVPLSEVEHLLRPGVAQALGLK